MIERMFEDTLWIYTAIAGSLFGAAFLAYFRNTHAGIWCYGKLDEVLDFFIDRYNWTWLKQPENAWRKRRAAGKRKLKPGDKNYPKTLNIGDDVDEEMTTTADAGIPQDTKNMGPRVKTTYMHDRRRRKDQLPVLLKRFRKYMEDNG